MNEKLKINNKWLIFARKINRLTRYDVSTALNIPLHTIEDWEHSNYMNYEDMKKIMGYYNKTPLMLLNTPDPPNWLIYLLKDDIRLYFILPFYKIFNSIANFIFFYGDLHRVVLDDEFEEEK